jgi:hypothetical protein
MPNLPNLPDGLADALGPTWPTVLELAAPDRVLPVWATVELDRAAASIAIASRSTPILDAPQLGARVRVIGLVAGADPPEVIVAEPSFEGRLAAFLARHGEGWAAAYVVVAASALARLREAAVHLSSPRPGPLGPERLLLGSDRSGPFVVVAEAP